MPIVLNGGTALLDAPAIVQSLDILKGYTIADLGCGGSGHFVSALSREVGPSGCVYAVDIQKGVLRAVEAKCRLQSIANVKTIWSNLEVSGATPIESGSCDVAIIINVLFQNTRHEAIMGESARLIRRGGRLAVIDWAAVDTLFGPPRDRRVSAERVREFAGHLSLRFLSETAAGPVHDLHIYRKD